MRLRAIAYEINARCDVGERTAAAKEESQDVEHAT